MRTPTLYIVTAPFITGGHHLLLDEQRQCGRFWTRPDDAALWAAHNAPAGWQVRAMKAALPVSQSSTASIPPKEGRP